MFLKRLSEGQLDKVEKELKKDFWKGFKNVSWIKLKRILLRILKIIQKRFLKWISKGQLDKVEKDFAKDFKRIQKMFLKRLSKGQLDKVEKDFNLCWLWWLGASMQHGIFLNWPQSTKDFSQGQIWQVKEYDKYDKYANMPIWQYNNTRSLWARWAPTSSWRPFGPAFGPSGLLDFVLRALRALRPCDPRNVALNK